MTPPGATHTTVLLWLFAGFLLCIHGMILLFGGTRFWASAPFLGVALVLSAALCALQVWWGKEEPGRIHLSVEFWGLVACAGYAALRALFNSAVPFESWTEAYLLLCAAILWLAGVRFGASKHGWLISSLTLLVCGTIHSMWAILQHVRGDRSVLWLERPVHYAMRASGTFFCPNHFGFLLQMGVIVALGLLVMPRVRLSIRVFAGYAWVMMFGVLLLTLSRSAVMGAIAGMAVVLLFSPLRNHLRRLLLVGMAGLVLLTGAVVALFTTYEPARERLGDFGRTNIRWALIWPDTIGMIQGEGLWGSGPGTFAHVFDLYREKFNISWLYLEYAHNEFLHVLAEYGWIPFLLITLAAIGVCVRLARSAWREGATRSGMIPALMLGLWVGSLVQAVFDFHLHITAVALHWVFLVAVFHGASSVRGVWSTPLRSEQQTRRILMGACVASLLLIWPSVRLAVGSYHGYQARVAGEAKRSEQAAAHSAETRRWLPGWYRGWRALGMEKRSEAFWMRNPVARAALVEESRSAYTSALERNPYDRISRAGLVELLKMERRWEEALEEVQRLRELAPFDAQVRVQEGLILRKMGNPQEALRVFLEAQALKRGSDRQIDINIRLLRETLAREP